MPLAASCVLMGQAPSTGRKMCGKLCSKTGRCARARSCKCTEPKTDSSSPPPMAMHPPSHTDHIEIKCIPFIGREKLERMAQFRAHQPVTCSDEVKWRVVDGVKENGGE